MNSNVSMEIPNTILGSNIKLYHTILVECFPELLCQMVDVESSHCSNHWYSYPHCIYLQHCIKIIISLVAISNTKWMNYYLTEQWLKSSLKVLLLSILLLLLSLSLCLYKESHSSLNWSLDTCASPSPLLQHSSIYSLLTVSPPSSTSVNTLFSSWFV